MRYADDWTLMVAGTRDDALALREEAAQVLARIGLHLSEEKTLITHIDEGLDFLGWRIQRHRKRGTNQRYVYTYPSRKALRAAMAKVKMWCRQVDTNQPLDVLLARINPLLQGWTAFFRPGVSSTTFQYLSPTSGAGWLDGSAASTPGSRGRSSAAATATADGSPGAGNWRCSTPGWSPRPGIATGDR